MRLATYQYAGNTSLGIVVRNPHDDTDWVFDPAKVEAVADKLLQVKGAGSSWTRVLLMPDKTWPRDMVGFLRLGQPGMDAARRTADFLERFIEQRDPIMLKTAGRPRAAVTLCPPVPEPRLLFGVVGNNAAFLRRDPTRGHNIYRPSAHQRTQTSLIGDGQPVVIPEWGGEVLGTPELGIIIGLGGRNIDRREAMAHVAGYTIVNDLAHMGFYRHWTALDAEAGIDRAAPFHFHSSNAASWLSKKGDTMCPAGPYLVTPEEVGDPYDLLSYYREGGIKRTRGYTGTLCCGIEEGIAWVSRFVTLEPGMILHWGAMGQDGILIDPEGDYGPEYYVEAEIEKVGTLRNPIVRLSHGDWRAPDDVGRSVHPVPLVRDLIAKGHEHIAEPNAWRPEHARHFWVLVANYAEAESVQGIPLRPYPLAYNTPVTALQGAGGSVIIPRQARTLSGACELGVVIRSVTRDVGREEAGRHILGYVTLAVLRDSSFADCLLEPHILSANMPEIYCRWPDGFNVVSLTPTPLTETRGRRMTFTVEGIGEIADTTDSYALNAPMVIAQLSRGITLLPGDVISLGRASPLLVIPYGATLKPGTQMRAAIEGLEPITATLDDQRAGPGA
jgi:2-keto-4-pentenoate hydratase/2-oxohepta-3-ene-1,7-dioic acid hydratase in catechol pathway